MNLLLVDDEIITIKGIQKGIDWEALPFTHVFSAASAQEAREIFKENTIDIMICDIEMPGENGIRLLEWVREQGYGTECIFLTCHEEFEFARKALQLKGMDYLLKPLPYDELQEKLKQAADKVAEKYVESRYKEYGKTRLEELKGAAQENDKKTSAGELVEVVKEYIADHLSEELSVELLARQVYLSSDYLFRIFKKAEGITPGEYITRARMFYAAELLKNPEISIGRAAMSVGYSNYCYFTRVFKKEYGVTPSEYQRNHRVKEPEK